MSELGSNPEVMKAHAIEKVGSELLGKIDWLDEREKPRNFEHEVDGHSIKIVFEAGGESPNRMLKSFLSVDDEIIRWPSFNVEMYDPKEEITRTMKKDFPEAIFDQFERLKS